MARFHPTLWTGGYTRGASQVSVTARLYPMLRTGGYIRGASRISVKARYSTTPDSVTARLPTIHVSVTERSYPSRTSGFTHGVLHVCKLACT